MGKYDTSMSTILGVPLSEPVLSRSEVIVVDDADAKIPSNDSDSEEFDGVRQNLEGILEKAENALETLTSLAVSEESPRAFEVLNTMLTTMASINMQLIEIEERKAKLKKLRTQNQTQPTQNGASPSTVNNNSVVFVGTTKELQEQIRQRLEPK